MRKKSFPRLIAVTAVFGTFAYAVRCAHAKKSVERAQLAASS